MSATTNPQIRLSSLSASYKKVGENSYLFYLLVYIVQQKRNLEPKESLSQGHPRTHLKACFVYLYELNGFTVCLVVVKHIDLSQSQYGRLKTEAVMYANDYLKVINPRRFTALALIAHRLLYILELQVTVLRYSIPL